ncbi:MAG: GspH/FimT family pseudopilin, partial [candidate division Zixibacteria bacterium]
VIIGIVASMAVPRFGIAMDRMEFRSVNRDVISTLRLARSQAISEKNEYGVYFNAGNLTATFFEKLGTTMNAYEDGTDRVVKIDTLGGVPGACLDGFGATFVNSAVIFDPDGSANVGGTLWTVDLTESHVGVGIISILPATGRISIETYIW